MTAENRILRTFSSFHPAANVREIRTQNVSQCDYKFFRNKISKFSRKEGHLPQKPHFKGFGGTLPARALQRWPLGLRRNWASLYLIVEEPRMFDTDGVFRMTCRFRNIWVQSHPYISGAVRKFAVFWLRIQSRLVRYTFHIWQIGRSSGSVAPIIT